MWQYRIIKTKDKLGDDYYSIHEYMDIKELGDGWTEDEVSPSGTTRDELRVSITDYINDITNLPILIVEDGKIVGEETPLTELNKAELNKV